MSFKLGHCFFFPAFCLELKRQLFLGLESASFQTRTSPLTILVRRPSHPDWNDTSSSPGSSACWLTLLILGLASRQNHVSQFLTHDTHTLLSLFLWRTLTNTQTMSTLGILKDEVLSRVELPMKAFQTSPHKTSLRSQLYELVKELCLKNTKHTGFPWAFRPSVSPASPFCTHE